MTPIRKKDILKICKVLEEKISPFCLYYPEGKKLYSSDVSEVYSVEVRVEEDRVGIVKGESPDINTIAKIIECFIEEIEEKKRVISHTLNKYRELTFLSELSEIMSSSIEINEILGVVTLRIKEIMGVENCSIMTVESEDGKFFIKAVSGRIVNEPCWLDINAGVAGRVFKSGKAVIINEPIKDHDFVQGGEVNINSLLCVPLRVKDKTVGVLNLSNKLRGGFTSEDESLLLSISVMVAGAIETYHLMEEKLKQERFATIGQMAAGIIHDIKNPMATIKGFAGLLGDMEFSSEERKEYSKLIVDEVNRLVEMIEDLLAFTRGFKKRLSVKEVDIRDFISEVLSYIEKEMAMKRIEVVKRLDYVGPVYIDPEKFKRVIFNISNNAKEALREGDKFLILCRKVDNLFEMVMADSGRGIPEEILPKVFEPFVTKGKSSGTGLGLAITKKIVEEHGGTIRAINENYSGIEGFSGANFIIRLPLNEAIRNERSGT
jgi:signal transduction histidine kinase